MQERVRSVPFRSVLSIFSTIADPVTYMIYQPDMTCDEGQELVRSRWLSFHFECAPVEEVSWLDNLLRTVGLVAIGLIVAVASCCHCCGEALSGCSG